MTSRKTRVQRNSVVQRVRKRYFILRRVHVLVFAQALPSGSLSCQDYEAATACLLEGLLPQPFLHDELNRVLYSWSWQWLAALAALSWLRVKLHRLRYTEPLELLQLVRGVLAEVVMLSLRVLNTLPL